MAGLLPWLGNAAKRLENTVNNDVVQPVARDVVQPVAHAAAAAPHVINQNIIRPVANYERQAGIVGTMLPGVGGLVSGHLFNGLSPTAQHVNQAAGLGVQRSLIGTGQGLSGLYDLATPGLGTNRISKGLNNLAQNTDATARQYHVNMPAYHVAQGLTDLAQFAIGSGEAKAAAKGVPGATKIAKPFTSAETKVAKFTAPSIKNGGVFERTGAKAVRNIASPKYQGANAAFTALQTGKQAAQGQKVTPQGVAANLGIGGLAFPAAGAVGHESAGAVIKPVMAAARDAKLVAPSKLTPSEVSHLSTFNNQARSGKIMDNGVYDRGVAAAQKAGIDYRNPTQIDALLGAHRSYDTAVQQRAQALQGAKVKALQFAQDHPVGMTSGAVDGQGNKLGLDGKPLSVQPTKPADPLAALKQEALKYKSADEFVQKNPQAAKELNTQYQNRLTQAREVSKNFANSLAKARQLLDKPSDPYYFDYNGRKATITNLQDLRRVGGDIMADINVLHGSKTRNERLFNDQIFKLKPHGNIRQHKEASGMVDHFVQDPNMERLFKNIPDELKNGDIHPGQLPNASRLNKLVTERQMNENLARLQGTNDANSNNLLRGSSTDNVARNDSATPTTQNVTDLYNQAHAESTAKLERLDEIANSIDGLQKQTLDFATAVNNAPEKVSARQIADYQKAQAQIDQLRAERRQLLGEKADKQRIANAGSAHAEAKSALPASVSPNAEQNVFAQNPMHGKGVILQESKPAPDGSKIVVRANRDPQTGHLTLHQERVTKAADTPPMYDAEFNSLAKTEPSVGQLHEGAPLESAPPETTPPQRNTPTPRDSIYLDLGQPVDRSAAQASSTVTHQTGASESKIAGRSLSSDIPQLEEEIKGHPSYPIGKKVSILDYFRTPDRVLRKIGLAKEAQALRAADHAYKQELPKAVDQITKWRAEVGNSPESSQRIFQYLDGQKVKLSPAEDKVAGEMKATLKQWADRLGIPEEHRITNYITHIFDESMVMKEFDPELEKLIADKVPGSVYDPYTQQRLGAKGYIEDAFRAMEAYTKRAVRKVNFDPALEQLSKAAESLDKSGVDYVKHYGDRINMRPTTLDNLIDTAIKQSPVGYKLGNRPIARISRGIRQATYRASLGLNFGSAVRNLTQGINTFAELGTHWTSVGYTKALQAIATGSDELTKTGVLDNSFVEDRTLSSAKQALQKADKGLFAFFEAAEKVNRGAAYFGAKAKALKEGKPLEEAIQAGVDAARKTQFTFGRVDTPVALQSDLVKMVTQFQSYNVKQAEFLGEMIKNREVAKLLRFTGASAVVFATVGRALGYSPSDFIPFGSNFTNSQSPFAGTPAFKLAGDAKNVIGKVATAKDNKTSTRNQQIQKSVQKLGGDLGSATIPAFAQAKKTVTGINAVRRGQVQQGSKKLIVQQTPGNYAKAAVFGPYSLHGTPKSQLNKTTSVPTTGTSGSTSAPGPKLTKREAVAMNPDELTRWQGMTARARANVQLHNPDKFIQDTQLQMAQDKAAGKSVAAFKDNKAIVTTQINKQFNPTVVQAYGLSSNDFKNYLLQSDPQTIGQLQQYDAQLYNAGLISSSKFTSMIGKATGYGSLVKSARGRATSSRSRVRAAKLPKAVKLPKVAAIKAPKSTMTKAKPFKVPKAVPYKVAKIKTPNLHKLLRNTA